MEWMINTQLGRRNLPPQQRVAVVQKFKKKIQEQAAIKANESRSRFHGNQHVEVCSPNGDHTKIKTDKEQAKERQSEAGKEFGNGKNSSSPNGEKLNIHTDKELAKMAGVGTGTVARYDAVMKSDNEDLKRKVKTGEVKIGTAYREVKKILTCNISQKC